MFKHNKMAVSGMIMVGLVAFFLLAGAGSTLASRPKAKKNVASVAKARVATAKASKTRVKESTKVRLPVGAGYIRHPRRLQGHSHEPLVVGRRRGRVVGPAIVRHVGSVKLAAHPTTVVVAASPKEPTVLPVTIVGNGSKPVSGQVVRVIDGQTLLVDTGAKSMRVRLLGVDLMTVEGSRTDFEEAAKQHLAELIEDQWVSLSYDDSVAEKDEDGVTVAYVRRQKDSALINLRMIRDGYALAAMTYDYQLFNVLKGQQEQAGKTKAGIWAYVEWAEG